MNIPSDYPDDLWYYNSNGEKMNPSWAEAYYCLRYDTLLYVFEDKAIDSAFDVIDVDEVKRNFLKQKCVDSINQCLSDWHMYFAEHIHRSKMRTIDKYSSQIKAKCLGFCDDLHNYQIMIPESQELLFDIIDGNLSLDPFNEINDQYRQNINKQINSLTAQYTKGKYLTLYDYYVHENTTVSYACFLKKINEIRINDFVKKYGNDSVCHAVNLGTLVMPFPFDGIGFFTRKNTQNYGVLYCDPMYNILIYQSQISNYRRLDTYIDLKYQLIEIPQFASPYQILTENKLKTDIDHDSAKIDKMYSYYDLPIYPDSFWREYGYRTKNEIRLIYNSICKYKYMAYNWLKERQMNLFLYDDDRLDILQYQEQ